MFNDKLESLLVRHAEYTSYIQPQNIQTSHSHISSGEDMLERIVKLMSNTRYGPNLISNAKNPNCNDKYLHKCSKF